MSQSNEAKVSVRPTATNPPALSRRRRHQAAADTSPVRASWRSDQRRKEPGRLALDNGAGLLRERRWRRPRVDGEHADEKGQREQYEHRERAGDIERETPQHGEPACSRHVADHHLDQRAQDDRQNRRVGEHVRGERLTWLYDETKDE